MKKLQILLIASLLLFAGGVKGQTNLVNGVSGTCPSPNLAFYKLYDGITSGTSFISYHGQAACDFVLTCSLTHHIKAARVKITSNQAGFRLKEGGNDYYTTQSGTEEFYYVNPIPGGFDIIIIEGNRSWGDTKLFEIEVYEVAIDDAGISYEYDNTGNMISRTLVLGVSSQQKSGEIEENYIEEDVFEQDILAGKNIKLYPNQTHGELKLGIDGMSFDDNASYKLFNSAGALIIQGENLQSITKISLLDQAAGAYLLNININGEIQKWTIIKK